MYSTGLMTHRSNSISHSRKSVLAPANVFIVRRDRLFKKSFIFFFRNQCLNIRIHKATMRIAPLADTTMYRSGLHFIGRRLHSKIPVDLLTRGAVRPVPIHSHPKHIAVCPATWTHHARKRSNGTIMSYENRH
jgi:hypothetical protein